MALAGSNFKSKKRCRKHTYRSLDEVGEAHALVRPSPSQPDVAVPREESDSPPGGESYVESHPRLAGGLRREPLALRDDRVARVPRRLEAGLEHRPAEGELSGEDERAAGHRGRT